ncbi:MAG: LCP family protein [Eubacteriales bacterium]|nr:LCP family protein [Eubacteriales bacterium]
MKKHDEFNSDLQNDHLKADQLTSNKQMESPADPCETKIYCRSKAKKSSGAKWTLRIFGGLLVITLLLGTGLWVTVNQHVNRFDPQAVLADEFNLPADVLKNPLPAVKGITNILLLGVDNRDPESNSIQERSDSMMILTVDSRHGNLKLTSLQRDISVYFPGDKTPNKINSANAIGGPLLAMRVVNDTFRLNITKFVIVNMAGLEQIIDAVDGVTVDVTAKELKAVNEELAMVNKTFPDTIPSPTLETEGVLTLNGRQAVTYARIRKIDSDYARMERQRDVLQALAKATLTAGPVGQYRLMTVGLSNITTNLSTAEMATIGLRSVLLLAKPIEQLQIPIDGFFNNVNTDAWKSLCDFNGMIPLLQDFIYGQTFPFDAVKKIKGAPNY